MARKRDISPEIWVNEQLGNVCREARLLFIGIISAADDDGRLKGSARILRAQVFPLDEDLPSTTVGLWRDALAEQGLICCYRVDGTEYLHLPTWSKWQAMNRTYPSKIPPCPVHEGDAHALIDEKDVPWPDVSREDARPAQCVRTAYARPEQDGGSDTSLDAEAGTEVEAGTGTETDAGAGIHDDGAPRSRAPATSGAPRPASDEPDELVIPPECARLHATLSGRDGYQPTREFLDEVAAYSGRLNLGVEAIKMADWLETPDAKRKKRRPTKRFVLDWLAREDAKRGGARASPQPIRAAPAVNGARPDKDWTKVARILTPNAVSPPPTETSA